MELFRSKILAIITWLLFALLPSLAAVKLMAADYTWTNLSANLPANTSITDMAWLSNPFSHKIFLATGTSLLQVNDDNTITTISNNGNYTALYQKVDAGYLWVADGSLLRTYSKSKGLSEIGISLAGKASELWASDTEYKGYAVGTLGISLFDAVWGTVTAKTTPGSGSISDVWAVDDKINSVYALSANGSVYRSTDGAASWGAVSGASDIRAMYFRNFNQGWAAGANGHIYKLNASGSWVQKSTGISDELCSIVFTTSGSCGVAVGKNGTVVFSGDEGETWVPLQVSAGLSGITKAIITEDKKIYLAGNKALFVGIPASTTGNNNLPAMVQMVTVQLDGDAPLYESYGSSVSDDGNYVAFFSRDDKLVANDTYDTKDFFLWDGAKQSITLTNTLADGARVVRNLNYSQISGDGKWIVMFDKDFLLKNRGNGSVAKFVTEEDYYNQIDMSSDGARVVYGKSLTNSHTAVCLYDRNSGSQQTIEMGYYGSGVGAGSHVFGEDAISGDGNTVVYSTLDYMIVTDPGGGTSESNMVKSIYVYSVGGASKLLFKSSYTDFGYRYRGVTNFSLNYDGRYFVHRDENGQIKLWDLKTGTSEIVSISTLGEQANGECWGTGISANGRYVVFYSAASNLVPNDTNGKFDVFLRDRTTGKTTLVSTNIAGNSSTERSNGAISGSQNLSISADGQYITYESQADNLVSTPKNSSTRCIFWAMLDVEKDGLTPSGKLTVSTISPATNISASGATVSGNVAAGSGATVSERGFVYGTSANPSVGGSGATKVTAGNGTGTFSATFTGLASNTSYHVRAYASDGTELSYGKDVIFTTAITTGVIEKRTSGDFLISPNPTAGIVRISAPSGEMINRVEVFSVLGNQVLSIDNFQENSLNLSGLPKGIYLVRINSQSGFYNQKIVKN
jgi:photosystem II stability/assembly factor-like uncharacterized protein